MNHPFSPSALNALQCATCKREAIDHTDRATCEVCGCSGEMTLTPQDILMCLDCEYKDVRPRTEKELNDRALEVKRRFAEIDSALQISTDIFNAKTIQIHQLARSIQDATDIPDDRKYFVLAEALDKRYTKLSELISGAKEEILHAENEQRAIQTYYNDLGKKLRQEEREKLRLKDATYKPVERPDVKKTPKAPSIKKAPNQAEIRAACVKHGIPEAVGTITMLMVAAKNLSVEDAIERFKVARAGLGK